MFNDQVLPPVAMSLLSAISPFISYVRLGEALVLDRQDGLVVYETDRDVPWHGNPEPFLVGDS
jgi:hypothetical protein